MPLPPAGAPLLAPGADPVADPEAPPPLPAQIVARFLARVGADPDVSAAGAGALAALLAGGATPTRDAIVRAVRAAAEADGAAGGLGAA
jgi:hypothetical protein